MLFYDLLCLFGGKLYVSNLFLAVFENFNDGLILTNANASGLRNGDLFEIIDNGNGISKEFLPLIFNTFTQEDNHKRGSGLGLSITKGLVDALDGSISRVADHRARFAQDTRDELE